MGSKWRHSSEHYKDTFFNQWGANGGIAGEEVRILENSDIKIMNQGTNDHKVHELNLVQETFPSQTKGICIAQGQLKLCNNHLGEI